MEDEELMSLKKLKPMMEEPSMSLELIKRNKQFFDAVIIG